jgi:hypothetical protein
MLLRSLLPHVPLGLVLLAFGASPTAQTAPPEAKQAFQAIQKEVDTELKELRASMKGLGEEGTQLYIEFHATVMPEFCERFAALARAHHGTDVALDAWSRILQYTQIVDFNETSKRLALEALDASVTDHAQAAAMSSFARQFRYGTQLPEEKVLASLRTLDQRSPHAQVRAEARLALAATLGNGRVLGDPRIQEAQTVLASVQADFADLRPSKEAKTYGEEAAGMAFVFDNLLVGASCPDFSALDAEGAAFKLSDYRGKVVLIDFWGFW